MLNAICRFLVKKGVCGMILRVIFEKFGVGIPKQNKECPLSNASMQLIKPENMGSQIR